MGFGLRGLRGDAPDLRIDVVERAVDFEALREEWTELLTSSRSDSLFLTWEWLYSWWTHFGESRRLFIVTVRSGSQLVAIAPLTSRRRWAGPLSAPVLEFAGTGIVGSDYLDVIVRISCETEALEALTRFLAGTGVSMRLPRIDRASAVAKDLGRALTAEGWESVEVATEICPFIDLSAGSWDHYLSTLGASHRYNFRRRLRNLNKEYDVRFRCAESHQDRREAFRHVVKLHRQRWQCRGGSDAFDGPGVLAFHEDVSRLALERGWLRLSVLELDGRPAAAFYCFRYGQTFHFYQSGFDPALERSSVGLVMMGLTIRDAIAEGATDFDLLHGTESYKFLWASQVRQLVRLELYPPGRLGRMHRNAAVVTAATKRFARRVLPAGIH